MNERIKELANKAVGKRSCYMIEAEYIKFAELIVRDVLDEVLQAMDDGMDVYDTVADKFGVEE
jgi:hypothetical protein